MHQYVTSAKYPAEGGDSAPATTQNTTLDWKDETNKSQMFLLWEVVNKRNHVVTAVIGVAEVVGNQLIKNTHSG